MKLFPQDDHVVLYETGFDGDLLDRQSISKQLSELVDKIEDPMVLALDDKWGAGKTYFLKRWVAAHTRENGGKAVTVYFDAFENDYLSDPLVAIVSSLAERMPDKQSGSFEKWKVVAAKLARPAFGVALSVATFGATKYFGEMGDVIAEATASEAREATKDLWEVERQRKDAMKNFKEILDKITNEHGASIVIVVDELDRCRPDYALSILEMIKHFFSVRRVHFVLGANLEALQSSVRARYGMDLDAERYLRKFISASFSLPRLVGLRQSESTVFRYSSYLAKEMGLPEGIAGRCIDLLSCVSAQNEVSLRDVGKILSRVALVPNEASKKKHPDGWVDILCVLVVASVVNPRLHAKLVTASATRDEIAGFLGVTRELVSEARGEKYNPNYKHNLAVWFAQVICTCGVDTIEDDPDLPNWRHDIAKEFDRHLLERNPKKIPSIIQRMWVDVFRM